MPEALAQNELTKKDRVTGKVVKTSLAGAVVALGSGKLGVVPISQLGNEAARNVREILKEGDEVTAWVRRVDNSGRIELTLIEPLAYEWRDLKPEMTVSGKVTKLEKFGAFVDIGAERPGLVHVSEMARGYVKSPDEKVKVGDEIQAKVLEVDRRKKQIKLSMKALLPGPETRKSDKKQSPVEEPVEEPEKPAPTAMEIALKKAMEKGEAQDQAV
ncbi:MAG: S1 RNA-binding domain-containing protein, partial [Anaerolineales bacterium]